MTSIYLVRHARSEGNEAGRFQGRTDTPLAPLGLEQAAYLAERFAALPLDAIYASPLQRARQTAAAIAACHNLEVQTEPDVIEIDLGDFENRTLEEVSQLYPQELQAFDVSPHLFTAPKEGESILDVYTRMVRGMGNIARRHPNQSVVVVSHGCAIRCYLSFAKAYPLERLGETEWGSNTGVSHIIYYQDKVSLHRINDVSHLPSKLITGGGGKKI
ncbi:MAG: histidine phosphatase family protein [Oscillospiraceae bacterium]|jgi:probable phosphoglycerate mutase